MMSNNELRVLLQLQQANGNCLSIRSLACRECPLSYSDNKYSPYLRCNCRLNEDIKGSYFEIDAAKVLYEVDTIMKENSITDELIFEVML